MNTIYLMAVKNGSSQKTTEVTQCLIFHPYSLIFQLFIINQPSTHSKCSQIWAQKKMSDSLLHTLPQNRVKTQKGSLNLLKNLNFAFLAAFWSTTGAVWFYNYSKTPDINQKSFKQLYKHCMVIGFFLLNTEIINFIKKLIHSIPNC